MPGPFFSIFGNSKPYRNLRKEKAGNAFSANSVSVKESTLRTDPAGTITSIARGSSPISMHYTFDGRPLLSLAYLNCKRKALEDERRALREQQSLEDNEESRRINMRLEEINDGLKNIAAQKLETVRLLTGNDPPDNLLQDKGIKIQRRPEDLVENDISVSVPTCLPSEAKPTRWKRFKDWVKRGIKKIKFPFRVRLSLKKHSLIEKIIEYCAKFINLFRDFCFRPLIRLMEYFGASLSSFFRKLTKVQEFFR